MTHQSKGSDRMDWTGLRVAITGGSSGLGLALAEHLHHAEAEVAIIARGRPGLERARRRHPGLHVIDGDVARKDDIHRMALRVTGALGGLDLLINNASSLGPVPLAVLADTDCEALETALATNLVGPFRLTKALLGALVRSARDGRPALAVNITSDAATTPYPGWGAYGASKAALHHLSLIWDAELAEDGVRVVALDPGDMDTPLHALAVPDADRGALQRPEDAARALLARIGDLLPGRTAP